jgi:hypothetical protein
MRNHDMWASAFGPAARLSGVFDPVERRMCRFSNVDFGENAFYEVG